MDEYHKIQTVFLRDPETNYKTLINMAWALPEFGYLANNLWQFTEKVDGTNIRVTYRNPRIALGEAQIIFGGKTDNASIPAPLVARLQERFLPQTDKIAEKFPDGVVLYGEGYGAKIQSGGNYRQDQDFVLFDVKIGDWWLEWENVEEIAAFLDLDIVPTIGVGNLYNMTEMVKHGFMSRWGNFTAEGIVARPTCELQSRGGQRIITKLKHKDFQHG